jgi:DNA uptake protein ComE-like DNA-binding protein
MAYYQNLPYPYVIRNGPFKTMRELLKVKGVTPELLYGEDTNLNGELDFNERDGDESWPPDNGDNKLDQGWIAYLTCYSYDRNVDGLGSQRVDVGRANEGELVRSLQISRGQARWIVDNRKNGYKSIADLISDGSPKKAEPAKGSPSRGEVKAEPLDMATFSSIADKITVKSGMQQIPGLINVNTASREVLKALLGGDASAEQAADRVVTYRSSVTGGMTSIADVLKVEGIKVATFKKIAELITVRSGVYTVRCFATAKRGDARGTNLQAEAVVDRSSRPCKVLHWYQGSGPYFANYRPTGSRG